MSKVKNLNKQIEKFSYFLNPIKTILKINAYADLNTLDKIDFFGQREEFQRKLMTNIYFPYIIEKFIVFAVGTKKNIELNKITQIYSESINIGNNIAHNNDGIFLSELFFYIGNEQIPLQEINYTQMFYRYTVLFNDSVSQTIAKEILGVELDKFIVLCWALGSFILNSKTTPIKLNISKFSSFILKGKNEFTQNDINNFIDYVSIDRETFKEKYYTLRKVNLDIKESFLDDETLDRIDRYLPKVSFHYPLLKDGDNYYITSFTAIIEFLKLGRVYSDISENKIYNKYKIKILGTQVEKYLRNEIELYCDRLQIEKKIYGDENYKIGKQEYSAPDVIFETDNYIFIIECKTSAFNLITSIQNFKKEVSSRIEKDLEKSEKNVKRYLDEKKQNETKKIYKFLMYFNSTPITLSSLKFELFKDTDFILTDINSIEYLFMLQGKKLDIVIDNFLIEEKKGNHNTLYDFLRINYSIDNTIIENIFEKKVKFILGEIINE